MKESPIFQVVDISSIWESPREFLGMDLFLSSRSEGVHRVRGAEGLKVWFEIKFLNLVWGVGTLYTWFSLWVHGFSLWVPVFYFEYRFRILLRGGPCSLPPWKKATTSPKVDPPFPCSLSDTPYTKFKLVWGVFTLCTCGWYPLDHMYTKWSKCAVNLNLV